MTEVFLVVILLFLFAITVMLGFVLRRIKDLSPLMARLKVLEASQERFERSLKEEFVTNRQESARQSHDVRSETLWPSLNCLVRLEIDVALTAKQVGCSYMEFFPSC